MSGLWQLENFSLIHEIYVKNMRRFTQKFAMFLSTSLQKRVKFLPFKDLETAKI